MLFSIKNRPLLSEYNLTERSYALAKKSQIDFDRKKKEYDYNVDKYIFRLTIVLMYLLSVLWILSVSKESVSAVQIALLGLLGCFILFLLVIPYLIANSLAKKIITHVLTVPKITNEYVVNNSIKYDNAVSDYEEYLNNLNIKHPGLSDSNYNVAKYSKELLNKIFLHEENIIKVDIDNYENKKKKEYWLALNGYEFEEKVADLYRKNGYIAKVTQKSGDGGVDIILKDKKMSSVYVQCKNHNNQVGVNVVRELFGVMSSNNIKKGILVCSSGTTTGGYDFAKNNSIEIVTLEDLLKMPNQFAEGLEYVFDKETSYTIKRKDGTSLSGFYKLGCLYIYKEIFDSENSAMAFIENLSPIPDFVYQIFLYNGFSVYYFRLVKVDYRAHILRSDNNAKVICAATGSVIHECILQQPKYAYHQKYKKRYKRSWY